MYLCLCKRINKQRVKNLKFNIERKQKETPTFLLSNKQFYKHKKTTNHSESQQGLLGHREMRRLAVDEMRRSANFADFVLQMSVVVHHLDNHQKLLVDQFFGGHPVMRIATYFG